MEKIDEWKLNVLKINDIDITNISKDEAVKMFLESRDSIKIEVKRKMDSHIKDCNETVSNIDKKIEGMDSPLKSCKQINQSECKSPDCASNDNTWDESTESEDKLILRLDYIKSGITKKTKLNVQSVATQTDENSLLILQQQLAKQVTDRIIEEEHNLFEQCLAPEIDIEEITLRKSDNTEPLGLTVCYNSFSNNGSGTNNGALSSSDDTETCTEVYVSDILPESVAGRDGRLREGDQILQINGKDVKNKEETEFLIAENNNAVTLLISRYLFTDEDDFHDPSAVDIEIEDDDEDEFYDDNNLTYENCFVTNDYVNAVEEVADLILKKKEKSSITNPTTSVNQSKINVTSLESFIKNKSHNNEEQVHKNTSNSNTSSKTNIEKISQQSSVNSTIKTIFAKHKNQTLNAKVDYDSEHIYETIPEDSESEPLYCSPYESSTHGTAVVDTYLPSVTDALQLQQKQRVAQWLGIKPTAVSTTAPKKSNRYKNSIQSITYESTSVDLNNKNPIVRSVMTTSTNDSNSSRCGTGGVECTTNYNNNVGSEEHENSSSAYNTGGSTNSVSPLVLLHDQNNRDDEPIRNKDDELPISSRNNKIQHQNPFKEKSLSPKHMQNFLGKTVWISSGAENLHQPLSCKQVTPQQKLVFKQDQGEQTCPQFTAPNLSQYHFVSSQEVSPSPLIANSVSAGEKNNTEETMVWKVKRRPDGSRYIVRRPARSRFLRERAVRFSTEHVRNELPTTEDDTVSEVKIGRYWTKEERKKHFERAKERRHQYQQQLESSASALLSTLRIRERTFPKHHKQQEIFNQHTEMRFHRPNSSKTLNHCQLQFNTTKQQKLNSSHKITDISNQSLLPTKTMPQNTQICSTVDLKSSPPAVVIVTTLTPESHLTSEDAIAKNLTFLSPSLQSASF